MLLYYFGANKFTESRLSDPFAEISARVSGLEGLKNADQPALDVLRAEYGFLPREYEQFLVSVGWGEVAGFMFYSGPLELDEVFDEETAQASARIVLIADDMAGFHLGYIEIGHEWLLTDFDHIDLPGCPPPVNQSLNDYLLPRLTDLCPTK